MANKYDDTTFRGGTKRGTRKGVKANHPGIKLINVTNGEDVKRIPRPIAEELVSSGDWKFCPKRFKL